MILRQLEATFLRTGIYSLAATSHHAWKSLIHTGDREGFAVPLPGGRARQRAFPDALASCVGRASCHGVLARSEARSSWQTVATCDWISSKGSGFTVCSTTVPSR